MITFYKDGKPDRHYVGAVLTTRERNYYDDSDFYALAWDDEKDKITIIEYASTRYGGGGDATVDATPEVITKANIWAYQELKRYVWERYVADLKTPAKGDEVVVAKGRKVPVGTKGKLFWIGEEQIFGGYSRWSQKLVQKVGIALDEEKDEKGRYKNVVWTYLSNLEVADVSKKFKYSEAKARLKGLKARGWDAYLAFQAYPLEFIRGRD